VADAVAPPPSVSEVEEYAGLVTHHLGVMTGRDRHHLTGPQLLLGAVAHVDAHAALLDVAEVGDLAELRLGNRLYVDRPAPTRLKVATRDRSAGHRHHVSHALALEQAGFVRLVETLYLDLRHHNHPRDVPGGRDSPGAGPHSSLVTGDPGGTRTRRVLTSAEPNGRRSQSVPDHERGSALAGAFASSGRCGAILRVVPPWFGEVELALWVLAMNR
jgi:hypothetical protein